MGKRYATGIRVNRHLWKEFKKDLQKKGLSTCFVLETMIQAWLAGHKAAEKLDVHKSNSIVVNQKIEYKIARARRRKSVYRKRKDMFFDVDSVTGEVHETNRYVNPPGMWIYDPDY